MKAYRLNNFLHELIKPEFRKQFLTDAEPLFQQYDLTEEERKLVGSQRAKKEEWLRRPGSDGYIDYNGNKYDAYGNPE